ncbi:MAG: hypothetical protein Q8J64_08790 [Thermodesulfovibrionales bacterium]|nr:hypothetical protein [Thermodesulfovibrionales bacterium]
MPFKRNIVCLSLVIFLSFTLNCYAEKVIKKWTDRDGVIHYEYVESHDENKRQEGAPTPRKSSVSPSKTGYSGGLLTMKLLKVGSTSASVEYNGQKITVRKYYPRPGEPLLGQSTNMGYLSPCLGHLVIAIVDDNNGEILSLVCEGNAVLVVPNEYIRL